MNTRLLGRTALLLLAVLTTIAVWRLRPQPQPTPDPPARSDYSLRDFELLTLNEGGREAFTVTGPWLERAPDDASLSLREPRFAFPAEGGGRWQAESRSAWVSAKADEVRLIDEVVFLGPEQPSGRIRFATARLDVFPDADRARAEGAVTVSQADSILRGIDLRADLATQRYQLSRIEGRYAPPRP